MCDLINVYEIGYRIKVAREEAGLTQQQLGLAVGLTWVTISQIENGKRIQLNPKHMREIAVALNKTEAYIYGFRESATINQQMFADTSPVLAEALEKIHSLSVAQQAHIGNIIKEILSLQYIG